MGPVETLAARASHDSDDAAGHAALDRPRIGDRNVFRIHAALWDEDAWLCKSNKIAAVITVTLHDLLLPLVPAMFFWQYRLGMWALYHRVPQREGFRRVSLRDYMEWTTFFTVGQPLLVGSLFFAIPAALLVYFGLRGVLIRARAKSSANGNQPAS